jgi:glutathione peroxidase
MGSVYEFSAADLQGREQALEAYRGQTLLIVNVASRCGFTPQYAGLEALYRRHRESGFAVLGFPCNQFGRQEPGDADEIRSFCSLSYEVSFPLFAKIAVNGKSAHPLYQYLKQAAPGALGSQAIKWNFTKFLVDKTGQVRRRYAPLHRPERLEGDVLQAL